jgi:hypothetical protein
MPAFDLPQSSGKYYQTILIIRKMTMKTTPKGIRRPQLLKAASLALLFLNGNQLLAQVTSSKPQQAQEGISVMEILGYVAMIVGVILLAWIIGAAQSKKSPADTTHVRPTHHRHFEHPNDPHFRRLKKKTS